MSIYVELLVRSPIEKIWAFTQQPELHERWDLRFSRIQYLPSREANAQRFRYATRLGFGIEIEGTGETAGQRDLADGSSVSALSFRSADSRSLIREGSGYWKYVPGRQGVRFLTSYDYEPRFGRLGRLFDSLVFRPLMGWATAWSFDRLRIWLEHGIEPGVALRHALIHGVSRWAIALVFIYQGTFPKVLARNVEEQSILVALGVPTNLAPTAVVAIGVAEILFGLSALIFWRSRLPAVITVALMVLATFAVVLGDWSLLSAAFNPISLNLAVAALAGVDLLTRQEWTPTASRCLRAPPANSS